MSDIVENVPAMGSEDREPEVPLAEDPDALFRARLIELKEAERALLTANISIVVLVFTACARDTSTTPPPCATGPRF